MPLFDKSAIKSDFSRAAKGSYEKSAELQKETAHKLFLMVKEEIKPKSRVLDLGSGTGFIAKNGNKIWNMVQIDITSAMCNISSSFAPAVNADMEFMPFKNNSFDCVISSLAIQWANDIKKVMGEANRVLRNEGKLFFTTFGKDTLKELDSTLTNFGYNGHISNFSEIENIRKLMKKSGFKDIICDTEKISMSYPDLLTLMKKIKNVGGGNKLVTRKKTLNKETLKRASEYYKSKFPSDGGIKASWQIIYVSGVKT